MIQLLNAIALTAAAGILLPILIHLWNVRTGKTLRVGSIALIKERTSHRARKLKISQWLLLAVRCLLILTLALLLAQPVWKQLTNVTPPSGWILVEKSTLPVAYRHFADTLETLQRAGYELHALQPDFPLLSPNDTTGEDSPAVSSLSYWELLGALGTILPDSVPVHLFTDQRLAHFAGKQPRVAHPLHWYAYPPADSTAFRLVEAYPTVGDSLRFIGMESTPTGNRRIQQTFSSDQEGRAFTLTARPGAPAVRLTDYADTVALDTAVREVVIYEPSSQPAGGDYVYAALKAIEAYTGQAFRIVRARRRVDLSPSPDVLFWLSEEAIPSAVDTLVKETGVLFSYATGPTRATSTWLMSEGDRSASPPVALYQRIVADSVPGDVPWSDGFGHAVLSRLEDGAVQHYRFFSRFDPAWTSLVWRAEWVQWLTPLVIPAPPPLLPQEDLRGISSSQMKVPIARTSLLGPPSEEPAYPLSRWVWLVGFVLFAVERFLSYRQKTSAS